MRKSTWRSRVYIFEYHLITFIVRRFQCDISWFRFSRFCEIAETFDYEKSTENICERILKWQSHQYFPIPKIWWCHASASIRVNFIPNEFRFMLCKCVQGICCECVCVSSWNEINWLQALTHKRNTFVNYTQWTNDSLMVMVMVVGVFLDFSSKIRAKLTMKLFFAISVHMKSVLCLRILNKASLLICCLFIGEAIIWICYSVFF